ncbi:MAG TPA: aminodeoxychorismate/anthranilate synthase component II [Chloroflexota bacterium]|nr:aminodeoxychorismate/anthranilate synthase component II [Chloroflexota bacterium]HZU04841.1 aminodeoxychorismate/anthranilate synthase component II [Chloroflexota bacterium]
MLLLIDNYDSFTYNLYQYLAALGVDVLVRRNDALTLEEIAALAPERIVISPGPGTPTTAGVSLAVVRELGARVPILGVCLGHQCIGEAYGGQVVRAPELRHGKTSAIYHDGRGVLRGLPSPFEAVRYHSLVVAREGLPDCLEVSAWTADGLIMGLRHREYPVEGVQFHPESVLTEGGLQLLANFVGIEDASRAAAALGTAVAPGGIAAAGAPTVRHS